MPDVRATTRVLDELMWSLRRGGFVVATSQAIDVIRAARATGFQDRFVLKEAIAAVVVKRARERARFDLVFDQFFARRAPKRTLWERLQERAFSAVELEELRRALASLAANEPEGAQHLGALLERGPDLDRLLQLAGIARAVSAQNRLQLGFYTYRVLQHLGMTKAQEQIAALRAHLRQAFGAERGDILADAIKTELESTSEEVRVHVAESFERRSAELTGEGRARTIETASFTSLSDVEIAEVRRAVRHFALRLRGGARVRARRARRGRIDASRTLRRALATGGAPFVPVCKRRHRGRPRLVLICDVSDSVRAVATFMLEFAYAAQELFNRTRSFVFVSELGETTELFERENVSVALGMAYGGGVVSISDNSNYGRMLRVFETKHLQELDRQTTVVILGDGRTNYHDDAADVLDRIRERARALLWLCPDAPGDWALGDSAMPRYAPKCNLVLQVRCARDLEDAARAILLRR